MSLSSMPLAYFERFLMRPVASSTSTPRHQSRFDCLEQVETDLSARKPTLLNLAGDRDRVLLVTYHMPY